MAPRWSADVNIKFVKLYRLHECLWDPFHPLYTKRFARESSLTMIACEMDIEGFGSADVNRKIKALRATYYSELAKHESSKKSGGAHKLIYTPTLRWLKDMKHIITVGTSKRRRTKNVALKVQPCGTDDEGSASEFGETDEGEFSLTEQDPLRFQPLPFTSTNTMATPTMSDEDPFQTQSPTSSIKNVDDEEPDEDPLQLQPQSSTPTDNFATQDNSVPIKRFKTMSKSQQIIATSREEKEQLHQSVPFKFIQENEFDIFGKHVASQLKQLTVEHAVNAIGEINNILVQKRLASLSGVMNANDCGPTSSSSSS